MNPYLLGLLSVASILVALGATVVVIAGFASRKRLPVRPAIVAVLAWALFGWTQTMTPPGYDRAEIARLDQVHESFRPRLERYRASHGEYPATLAEAGITTPETRWGPLGYQASRDDHGQPRYWLVAGDYVRNGFVSTWRSETGQWGLRSDD